MNVIREYTIAHIKQNKRSSIFIFLAILIASSLICAMSVFIHALWTNEIDYTIEGIGNWHGLFEETIAPEQLKYITENPNVETTLVQTDWKELQLSGTKRSYMVLAKYDSNYWTDMPIKDLLIEGRLPQKQGEILVSKLFFTENPQYKAGDTLILPKGQRVIGGKALSYEAMQIDGETFLQDGEEKVTVVGTLDLAAVSAYPCYHAYGFLDIQKPEQGEMYRVAARVKDEKKVYEVFAQIVENLDMKKDVNSYYKIRYNTNLLALYGVKNPGADGYGYRLSGFLLMGVLTVALVMAVFIVIIYNAFAVSTNSQMKQLGILKSIGATPGQIRSSVLLEGLLLACLAIPFGIGIGYASVDVLIQTIIYEMGSNIMGPQPEVTFSWFLISGSVIMSFVTVLLSAWMPARRVARQMPVEAVCGTKSIARSKKLKGHPLLHKWFGFEGELAKNAFAANRKSFCTTLVSLTLCLALIVGFVCFSTIMIMDSKAKLAQNKYSLNISIFLVEEPDSSMMEELMSIPGIEGQVLYRSTSNSIVMEEKQMSPGFLATSGFSSKIADWSDLKSDNGKVRIYTKVIGMGESSFAEYCKKIGANPEDFTNPADNPATDPVTDSATDLAAKPATDNDIDPAPSKAIVVNSISGNSQELIDKYKITMTPFLDLHIGDTLFVEEKSSAESKLKGSYSLAVDALTDQYPELDEKLFPLNLVAVVPMTTYNGIVQNFSPERTIINQRLTLKMSIAREQIDTAQTEAERILDAYLARQDWSTRSLLDEEESYEVSYRLMSLMISSFAIFLGFVGISGAFSSVSGSLNARRREFAVLRSTGLTPKGMNKMLLLESIFFGLFPMVLCMPIIGIGCGIMIERLSTVTWIEFLIRAPWGQVFFSSVFVVGSIWLAYRIVGTKIRNQNIVEAIKDETI